MSWRLAMLAVILYAALGSFAYAHHSHFYDECKSTTIEGRVERVEFKNPHNLIVLRLDDGTTYTFDWVSLTRLTSAGIIGAAKEALVSGARVAVTGNLIRDAAEIRRFVPKFKGEVNVIRPKGGQTGILLARADGDQQASIVGQQFAGRVGMFMRVDDFDSAYERMVAAGVQFVSPPRDERYGRLAVFLDLEGNRWDLLGQDPRAIGASR
jgi:uncharacterized glyoxalase superfamily protein PhnB